MADTSPYAPLPPGHPWLRAMGELAFFRDWRLTDLRLLGGAVREHVSDAGTVLIERGTAPGFATFLLDGEVSLAEAGGTTRTVNAGTDEAGFPLAHLRPTRYAVVARSAVRLLRVELSRLRREPPAGRARFTVDALPGRGAWRAHPLTSDLFAAIERGELQLPALPAIVLRIRNELATDQANLDRVAALISAEPVLAAKLVKVANSALYGGRCASVGAALVRLGTRTSTSLVAAFAAEQVFRQVPRELARDIATGWRHGVEIAILCSVLARLSGSLQPDQAMLLGLVHDIGQVAALTRVHRHPDLARAPELRDEILAGVTPELSARIITAWDLPAEFAAAALSAEDWYRDSPQLDYGDLLVVAHLHDRVRRRQVRGLPRIDETPAFSKLPGGRLSPALSLAVLEESRQQQAELRGILG